MKKTYIVCVKYQMGVEAEDIQEALKIVASTEFPNYKEDSFEVREAFRWPPEWAENQVGIQTPKEAE